MRSMAATWVVDLFPAKIRDGGRWNRDFEREMGRKSRGAEGRGESGELLRATSSWDIVEKDEADLILDEVLDAD